MITVPKDLKSSRPQRKHAKPAPNPPRPSQMVYAGPSGPDGTVEFHATKLKTNATMFRISKLMNNWPQGAELSEAEYQAAIDATSRITLR